MMAINLLGFVVQLGRQRHELGGGQGLTWATEGRKENCVHTENLPRNIPNGEVEVVQFAHPQLLSALADFAKYLRQEGSQSFAVQVRRELASHHQAVRQG